MAALFQQTHGQLLIDQVILGEQDPQPAALVLLGDRLRQNGQWAEARQVWKNLADVFQGVESEKEWVRRTEKGLADLQKQAAGKERWAPVRAALKQAAELRDQGKREQAEAIWRGVEALYQGDPDAAEILQAVAAARKQ